MDNIENFTLNNNYEVDVRIKIRKNMKTLKIGFDKEKCYINVRHGGFVSDDTINKYVNEYIDENYSMILNCLDNYHSSGVMVWGEEFALKNSDKNYIDHDHKIVYLKDKNNEKMLDKLMKEELIKEINKRKYKYQDQVKAYPNQWKIRKVKTYWGRAHKNVFNKDDWYITINRNIVKEPINQLEETMVHELCHYHCWDHNIMFKKLLNKKLSELNIK